MSKFEPRYIFYKPCINSSKVERIYAIDYDERAGEYTARCGGIPEHAVLPEPEGRLLWMEQRINALEEAIKSLLYNSHTHWYKE